MRHGILILGLLALSCSNGHQEIDPPAPAPDQSNDRPPPEVPGDAILPVERRIEAISFLGDTLSEFFIDEPIQAQRERQFEEARLRWVADPTNIDAIIWAGRRAAYVGRYQEAILIYGLGIRQYPDEPRLYRHRGHRYITTRQLDSAVVDLETATRLMASQPDQVEPDGLPNAQNIPTSTLHTNVWYHLGLASYLLGQYLEALTAFEECLAAATNRDMEVAARYWLYLTLVRLDRPAEALETAAAAEQNWDLVENFNYRQLLLVFDGVLPGDSLLPATGDGSVASATMSYGLAQWLIGTGRQEEAGNLLTDLLASGQWPAFGYIAAEADSARVLRQ